MVQQLWLRPHCLLLVLISIIAWPKMADGQAIIINTPTVGQTFAAGSDISISYTVTSSTLSYTHIDIHAMIGGSISSAGRIAINIPITTTTYTWRPSQSFEGEWWLVAVPTGTGNIAGYGPYPRGDEWGANTFTITSGSCIENGGHNYCLDDEYCDAEGKCWNCESCAVELDSYDMFCPSRCGGTSSYTIGDSLPNSTEAIASGPIRDVVRVGCSRYNDLVTLSDSRFIFETDVNGISNLMTVRLKDKLLQLVSEMQDIGELAGLKVVVEQSYQRPPNNIGDATIYNEGRAARISLEDSVHSETRMVLLFALCGATGFDYVEYRSATQIHLSVVPDTCTVPVDLMFLLDSSGSIDSPGSGGSAGTFQNKVLGFVQQAIPYFNIGNGLLETRIGVATFSSDATLHIPLNGYFNATELGEVVSNIPYDSMGTYTSEGINLIRTQMMTANNGLRALEDGVTRVVIVVTDGESTPGYEPAAEAAALESMNVNVFAMGVGSGVNTDELYDVASTPDNVYFIKNFDRVLDIVADISSKACDAPAVLTAGAQTTTSVMDCDIKYFRPECPAVSGSPLQISVTSLNGSVEVYVSLTSTHPGPFEFDYKDDTQDIEKEILVQRRDGLAGPVYVAIKGTSPGDSFFTLDVWSDIFKGTTRHSVTFIETVTPGTQVYAPPLSFAVTGSIVPAPPAPPISTNVRLSSGNNALEGRVEVLVDGLWGTVCDDYFSAVDATVVCGELGYGAGSVADPMDFPSGSASQPIHFDDVDCSGTEPSIHMCTLQTVHNCDHAEDVAIRCTAAIIDTGNTGVSTDYVYSILSGNDDSAFAINDSTGVVSIGQIGLDYERATSYSLRITGSNVEAPCLSGFMDLIVDVNNINDNRPTINGGTDRAGGSVALPMRIYVSEDTPVQTMVLDIEAEDPDGVLSFSLSESNRRRQFGTFRINEQTGEIFTTSELDCETQGVYNLIVIVSDGGGFATQGTITATCQSVNCDFNAGEYSIAGDGTFPCSTTSECTATQYESVAPTITSNRICLSISQCTLGDSYETSAPTATSNRICTPQPSCSSIEYETTPPTLTSVRVCEDTTSCSATQYERVAPTASSDRVCIDLSICGVTRNTYEFRLPTLTSDRTCRSITDCNPTQEYESSPPTATSNRGCTLLTQCQFPAMFESVAPSQTTDRICTEVSSCTAAQYISSQATPSSNTGCTALTICNSNQYETVGATQTSDRSCDALTTCVLGSTYQSIAPSSTSNRVCSAVASCNSSEFEHRGPSLVGNRDCRPLSVCNVSEWEVTSATTTSDRLCRTLTVCSTASAFESTAPTQTSDRVCSGLTQCGSSEFESVPNTATSNRVCSSLLVCSASQYESVPPTDTSNRQCLDLTACVVGSTFETVVPTATSNRVCESVTDCTDFEFEAQPPSEDSNRICTAYTVCNATTEYETLSASLTSDRQCTLMTQCGASEFESTTPTQTSDRVCTSHLTCTSAEYETTAPTWTSDRSCEEITVCMPGEYIGAESTLTSDRICLVVNADCPLDNYIVAPATSTSNIVCQNLTQCILGLSFEALPPLTDRDRVCSSLSQCDVGEYEFMTPTLTSNRVCNVVTPCNEYEYQVQDETATTNRVCADVLGCTTDEYEISPPTSTSDATCQNLTLCLTNEFETVSATETTDRVCTAVSANCNVTAGEFESLPSTATTDRTCSPISTCNSSIEFISAAATTTSDVVCIAFSFCVDSEFEFAPPSDTSDRLCNVVKNCDETDFETIPPTATTDRICQVASVCSADEYTSIPHTFNTDTVCSKLTNCTDDEYIAIKNTESSDRFCSPYTLCKGEVLKLGTRESDRVCAPDLSGAADASTDESSSNTGVLIGVILAIVLCVILAALFARYKMKRPIKDIPEESATFGVNPMYLVTEEQIGNSAAVAALVHGTPSGLTQNGDRLWTEYRRCTAFDHMYFGNPIMKIGDEALEDVYALLAVTCPPRSFFKPLRNVGDRFCTQVVPAPRVANHESTIDDVVDYITRAMPDVLLERIVDMLSALKSNNEHFQEVGDEVLYESFYAMVDDYAADLNMYLAPDSDGFNRMHAEGAYRELYQVDPIYYEVGEEEMAEYSAVSAYAMADTSEEDLYALGDSGPTYDLSANSGGEDIYTMASSDSADNIYDAATMTDSEAIYSMGEEGDNIYNIAAPKAHRATVWEQEQPLYNNASSGADDEIYGLANAPDDDDDDAIYSMGDANDNMYSMGAANDNMYSMGAANDNMYSMGEANDNMYSMGEANDAIYAIGNAQDEIYSMGEANDELYAAETMISPAGAGYSESRRSSFSEEPVMNEAFSRRVSRVSRASTIDTVHGETFDFDTMDVAQLENDLVGLERNAEALYGFDKEGLDMDNLEQDDGYLGIGG